MSQGPPRGLVRSIGAIMKIGLSKVMDKGLDLCSPTWVHIPPLGPHRASSPFPLAHTLGQDWNDAPEVDVAKKKK